MTHAGNRFRPGVISIAKEDLEILDDDVVPHCDPSIGPPSETVEWDELEAVADKVFSVFLDNRAPAWAKAAWQHLRNAGLTGYDFELQRTEVCLRFFALGHLYQDWCGHALEQGDHGFLDIIAEWNDELGIQDIFLGQLTGRDHIADHDESNIASAMRELVCAERPGIVAALRQGYGGESEFFFRLWSIHGDNEEESLSEGEMRNTGLTASKIVGYEWVSSGCPILW